MSSYVRYKPNGEVRMDFYTFKTIPFTKIMEALKVQSRLIRPHGRGTVREFK